MKWTNPFPRLNLSKRHLVDNQQDDLEYADEFSIPGHLDLVDEATLDMLSLNRVRRTRVKITVYALSILGIISLAIGSGIIFAKRYQRDLGVTSSLNSADSATSTANITSHKAYINNICSSSAISSLKGKLGCADACADSSCCRTMNAEENCMSNFPAVCLEFEACNILLGSTTTDNVNSNYSMIIEASEQPVTMSPVNLSDSELMNSGIDVSTILDILPIDSGLVSTNNSNEIDLNGVYITGNVNASTPTNTDATEHYISSLDHSLNVTPSVTVMGANVSVDGIVYDKNWLRNRVNDTCISVDLTMQENLIACKQLCESAICCYREEHSCVEEAEFCDILSKCEELLMT